MRKLLDRLLLKDPNQRPSIVEILKTKIVKDAIVNLGEEAQEEFSDYQKLLKKKKNMQKNPGRSLRKRNVQKKSRGKSQPKKSSNIKKRGKSEKRNNMYNKRMEYLKSGKINGKPVHEKLKFDPNQRNFKAAVRVERGRRVNRNEKKRLSMAGIPSKNIQIKSSHLLKSNLKVSSYNSQYKTYNEEYTDEEENSNEDQADWKVDLLYNAFADDTGNKDENEICLDMEKQETNMKDGEVRKDMYDMGRNNLE